MQTAMQRRMHPDHARCVKEMREDELAARRATSTTVGGALGDAGGAGRRDGDQCAEGCWDASPGQRRYADGRAIIRSPRAALLSQLEVQRELERTSMRVIHQPPTATPTLPQQEQPPYADGATVAATPVDATAHTHHSSPQAAGHTRASPMKLVDDAPPSPALLKRSRSESETSDDTTEQDMSFTGGQGGTSSLLELARSHAQLGSQLQQALDQTSDETDPHIVEYHKALRRLIDPLAKATEALFQTKRPKPCTQGPALWSV